MAIGGLPRRRPARGGLLHRADHGHAGARAGHGPGRAAAQQLHPARRLPLQDRRPASPTTAASTSRRSTKRAGDRRLRRAARRAGAAARSRGATSASASSTYTEICGFGPFESAAVRVEPSGHGHRDDRHLAPRPGAGDDLRADRRRRARRAIATTIVVVHGDTGTHADRHRHVRQSRGLVVGGVGARAWRSNKVKEKARRIAAHLLEAAPEDIEFARWPVRRQGRAGARQDARRDRRRRLQRRTCRTTSTPAWRRSTSSSRRTLTFPFGAHVAVVEVDADTGRRHAAASTSRWTTAAA